MMTIVAFVVALSVLLSVVSHAFPTGVIKINPDSHSFVDSLGRTRVFHGVNAVYKVAPWYPQTTGFDFNNSLSDIDAANLKSWGFNVLRLGVMWPGVEPGERGVYDQTYLDNIETIVTNMKNNDIYVILDFHQDLLHRKFCGEGVPDYVYNLCVKNEPQDTKPFPLPAVNYTYPIDSDGNPSLDACLSSMFATYYMSNEVGYAFQCLYDNVGNLWDALAGYWVAVAKRFSKFENVLGYELINEPWAGNTVADKKMFVPGYTENNYLQPMYEHLHKAIRAVDDEKIIFFEGLTIDYFPNGFTAGPGGPAYNDRQALAYHIYCPVQDPSVPAEAACDAINDFFFAMRTRDVERIGGGMIMTEFGASEDVRGDIYALEKNVQQADKHLQSWMYWQFKYFQDITTCTPIGESLYNSDGSVNTDKISVLSRTYAPIVAGVLNSNMFHPLTSEYELNFTPSDSITNDSQDASVTTIYFNRELYYPHGAELSFKTDGVQDKFQVSCDKKVKSSEIHLKQVAAVGGPVEVSVKPCRLLNMDACTCK